MNIKEYLQHVFELERSCYEQKRIIDNTDYEFRISQKPSFDQPVKTRTSKLSSNRYAHILYPVLGGIAGIAIGSILTLLLAEFDMSETARALVWALFIVAGVFVGMQIGEDRISTHRRRAAYADEHDVQAEQQREQISSSARAPILSTALTKAKTNLLDTQNTLDKFYEKGVLKPEYRNLAAIASFLEYINAGRCEDLEDPSGAYGIFEQEARNGLIVSSLDEAVIKLDSIEQNQRILADAIKESNMNASAMTNEISACADKLMNIYDNSRIAEYFGEISAMNMTYMDWLKKQ